MPCANWIVMVVLAGSGISLRANAAGPVAGEYATQPGWGSLVISADAQGRPRFELSTVGGNGHMCELGGSLQGTNASTDDGVDACRMTFDSDGARVSVQAVTEEACRAYCGMRAGFEGEYAVLPAACSRSARERRNTAFLSDYKAKRFPAALARLEGLERECGSFFDWLEADRFANDKAITLFHLGRPGECVAVLDNTLAADSHDEESLDETAQLPPSDRDLYLPIARAAWFNRDRCKAAIKPR